MGTDLTIIDKGQDCLISSCATVNTIILSNIQTTPSSPSRRQVLLMLIQNRQTVTSQSVCMKCEGRTEAVVTDGGVGEPALGLLHLARDGVGGVTHSTALRRGDGLTTQVLQLLQLLLNAPGQGHRLGTVALGTTS